ncbi:Stf0 sulfotransferase [Shimia sp. SK013]|uniref:Stf0 family sulfotransferase n=1 Tax=Shimia sp. SK013 TaxID=1389006 RepID=UPI0006B65B9E|nr:Stf0 family sulfotransferase [Shimia sp. SK013]KPA20252.1 Stf0 sulfotransferase [Shimia sp. SK013]
MPGVIEKIQYLLRDPYVGLPSEVTDLPSTYPDKRYVVFFTPRSGSTRLTNLIRRAGGLGRPDECFNPDIVPALAKKLGADSLETYTDRLLRARQDGKIFGCEVTYLQIMILFKSARRFRRAVNPTDLIWLIREDLVAQSVSASRMVQTGVSQSVFSSPKELAQADKDFVYDAPAIRSAMLRMLVQEWRTEAVLAQMPHKPLRLSYELVNAFPPQSVLTLIRDHLKTEPKDDSRVFSTHKKVSGTKSLEMSERFRAEHAGFVAWVDRRRAKRIAALDEARAALSELQSAS